MIEVKELTKRYGAITAIDHVSFRVEPGEILGFLGPNGAGKSTTMRILTGALGATEGEALIDGTNVAEHPKVAKRKFGYLPEIPPLYQEMTVRGYVTYAAQLRGVPHRDQKRAVDRALDVCGLTEVGHRAVGHLSKGYQQRVGLAQALVHDPPVLILDEPTIGLDPNQIMGIRRLIRDLAGKHTIILSTHILPEVTMTCHRVVIINKGKVVAQGGIDELSAQVRKGERLALLLRRPEGNAVDALRQVPHVRGVTSESTDDGATRYLVDVEPGHDVREAMAELAVSRGWGLLELRKEAMSLEEVFRQLTTEEATGDVLGTEAQA